MQQLQVMNANCLKHRKAEGTIYVTYEKLVALAVTEGSSLICLRSSKIQTIFRIENHLVVEEDK